MQHDVNDGGCHAMLDGAPRADQLTALAQEARLLEFGLDGDGAAATALASELESALTHAMDAESPAELSDARSSIDAVLACVLRQGMELSAQLSDIDIDGVLGTARMPVLTAVLRVPA